ncbi:glycosyltransferase family protein [Microbacterium keratanolyticum]
MLRSLRRLWRASRSAPVLGSLLTRLDRLWWTRTISRADVVDLEYARLLLGPAVTMRGAIHAYVSGGFREGLALNPLFLEEHVSAQLPDSDRVPALYAYLVADATKISTTLAWDAAAFAQSHPESVTAPGGPLGVAWRESVDGAPLRFGTATEHRLVTRAEVIANARDALRAQTGPASLEHPHTLIVWRLNESDSDGTDLRTVVDVTEEQGAAVLLDIVAAPRSLRVAAAQLTLPGARIALVEDLPLASPAPHLSTTSTLLVSRAAGASITDADLRAIIESGRTEPRAALWLAEDGTIASAGLGAHDGRGFRLFAGHPREDLGMLGDTLAPSASDSPITARIIGDESTPRTLLTAAAVTDDASVSARVNPDAELRLDGLAPGRGLEIRGWGPGGLLIRRVAEEFRGEDGIVVPRLRWAIKTAAPAGPRGEAWGDTHFARGLAAALERLGQYVAVDALPAAHRSSSGLDDVNLVLRGPERIVPLETGTSLLWIISHPDEITAEELDDFGLRYAASTPWAQSASRRLGHVIHPLAQCTDTTRFAPRGSPRTDDLVFVGTARGIARPSVIEPLRVGAPLRVYGPDWRGYIPASAITATHVPNEELPAIYEGAGAVLNDHWPAMRREGFVSNRLYDVIAAGGRAISDDVDGIAETFGSAVRTYRSEAELREIALTPLSALFPSDSELARIAERIRQEHSFDARARTLLRDVLAYRAD